MGSEYIGLPFYAYFSILVIEIVTGTLTNVFIVLVNLRDWLKGQSLNSSDKLVVSLALSNTCFSLANSATTVCSFFFSRLMLLDHVFYMLHGVMTYAIFSSSWLSAWLCLFFFLKIVSFKGGCLGRMKMKVELLVPWMIFLAQVMSFVSWLPFLWTTTKLFAQNSSSSGLGANKTSQLIGYKMNDFYSFFSIIINCFLPFLVVMVTTSRIIASLCLHARHMKKNMEDSHGSSLKVHQTAARTMSTLLVTYLIFYMVEMGLGYLPRGTSLYWICFMLILFFPALQSVILITGNSKLRHIWSDLMSCKRKY